MLCGMLSVILLFATLFISIQDAFGASTKATTKKSSSKSVSTKKTATTKKPIAIKKPVPTKKPVAIQRVLHLVNPKQVQFRTVPAKNGIGHVEDFQSFLKRTSSLYAMNGTFFSAYVESTTERFPFGLMVNNGTVIRGGKNVSFVIDSEGNASIHRMRVAINLSIWSADETPDVAYQFPVWNINHYFGQNTAQWIIYTPDFGKMVPFENGVKVVIENDVVTTITRDPVEIPKDGWVYFDGDQSTDISSGSFKKFQIGDNATFETSFQDTDSGEWLENVAFAIGSGPWLINNGTISIDYDKDEFYDKKIRSMSGNRGFLGIRKDGKIMIGYVSRATVPELATYLRQQGAVQAMNMDGNASGAFAVNGKLKWNAGRQLSNVVIVQNRKIPIE